VAYAGILSTGECDRWEASTLLSWLRDVAVGDRVLANRRETRREGAPVKYSIAACRPRNSGRIKFANDPSALSGSGYQALACTSELQNA
jgi:hypothetical protein